MGWAMDIYQFTVQDSELRWIPLSVFKGKVLLIVNTASLCGFTPQYKELEQLYRRYGPQGLVVMAFPCNQFAKEDPLPIKQIASSIRHHFGVSFLIMNKVDVNGDNASELFQYLKSQQPGKLGFKGVLWNFEKFLVDRNGRVVKRYLSEIAPLQFEPHITKLLN